MLSVSIITFNEEKNILRCLNSVKEIADEVVVLDSFSTDATVDMVRSWGAALHQQPFAGYIQQKNDALNLTSGDWVLCLDADEALDDVLIKEIAALKSNNFEGFDGFITKRCTFYCGKFIRHGSWYPDPKLRLFKKELGKWAGENPHDVVELSHSAKIGKLAGDLLHYSYFTLEEHILQNNRFSSISADAYFKKGKKSSWIKMLLNPAWAFVHGYMLMGGFKDGFLGYVIAKNVAHLTFMKYYKLYFLQQQGTNTQS